MIIAAHLHSSSKETPFLQECISRLAGRDVTKEFIVFSDKIIPALTNHKNLVQLIVTPSFKSSLLLHYWYNYKLPGLLKKYKAAVFLGEYSVCSLRTTVPQIMIVKKDFLQVILPWQKKSYTRYLKKYFLSFGTKAAAVCFTKPRIASEFIRRYAVLENKISVVLPGLPGIYKPIELTEKNIIQEKYTGGNEFFVCYFSEDTVSNMVPLLKAFSLFKKRLKSSMQLVLINKLKNNPIKDFHLYKYRQEVHIINCDTEEMEVQIIASAYAGIYLTEWEPLIDWGLHCLKCTVPLIALQKKDNYRQYEDAALYTQLDEKAIGEKMMLVYKD
ncbi:MAG: hypothetical protein H7X88_07875, partial [Gloeobacteraceae cyanobacterium ES-bin-316]|nr:hypothetical protein [Ferruginibacter sp.]